MQQCWLEQRRPQQPAVDATGTEDGWIERYRQAYAEWREDVQAAYGARVFDWFDAEREERGKQEGQDEPDELGVRNADPEAAEPGAQGGEAGGSGARTDTAAAKVPDAGAGTAGEAVQALGGRFHDFAANDDDFGAVPAARRWRCRADDKDPSAPAPIGRWHGTVDGVPWTLVAYPGPEQGADVTLALRCDAADAAAAAVSWPVAVEVLDPAAAALARAGLPPFAGLPEVRVALPNPGNLLRRLIRQARARLHYAAAGAAPR